MESGKSDILKPESVPRAKSASAHPPVCKYARQTSLLLYSTAQSPLHPSGLWTVDFSSAARTQLRRLKKQFAPLDGGPAAAVPLSLATAGSALQSVGKTMLNLLHKHATKSDRCFPFSIYFFLFSLSASGSGTRWDRQRGVDSEYEGGERNFLRPSERAVGEGPFSMPHLRLNVITPLPKRPPRASRGKGGGGGSCLIF